MAFIAATATLVGLIWSRRGTALVDKEGFTDGGMAFLVVFWVALTLVAYLGVQGSDPGYVTDEEMNRAEAEARGLLRPDGRSASILEAGDSEDEDEAQGGAFSSLTRPETTLRPSTGATAPSDAALVGMTEEELEAEVDKEMAKRVDRISGWLSPEEAAALGPGVPPRAGLPVRAQFCRVSQRYVHGFDHYCGFLATPIGERNHCRFWWFLLFQTCSLWTAIGIAHSGFEFDPTYAGWWSKNTGWFILTLTLWGFQLFVGSLWMLHTWLAATGSTSYELLKGPAKIWYLRHTQMCDYPFSRGLLINLRDFCCVSDGLWRGLYGADWRPKEWQVPGKIERDSEDVMEHCWENRYWSCC
jgi:hypothetical protein